jgi:hypothetical protein
LPLAGFVDIKNGQKSLNDAVRNLKQGLFAGRVGDKRFPSGEKAELSRAGSIEFVDKSWKLKAAS